MTAIFVATKGDVVKEGKIVPDHPEAALLDGGYKVTSVHAQTRVDRLDPSSHAAILRIIEGDRVKMQFGLEVGGEMNIPIGGVEHTFYHSGPRRERAG